jgi:hypothetical protein
MQSVSGRLRQKVFAGAAIAVLLAGGALAAVSATGQSSARKSTAAATSSRSRTLAAAAGYLGITRAQLSGELSDGKTLAQIAAATSGKSQQGLIEALEAAKKARLSAAAATLQRRVSKEVTRPGGPAPGSGSELSGRFATERGLGRTAASYLGLSPQQLQAKLRSGKSLAQIAEATAGKSSSGLTAALLAARRHRLDSVAASRRLSTVELSRRQARLKRRIERLVHRHFAGNASHG